MSDGLSCDRCQKTLLIDEDVRYVVEAKVYAAYDVLEVTAADLARNHKDEIARLAAEIANGDPKDLEDSIAKIMRLDLCPSCARAFREDPLGVKRGGAG